VWPQSSVISTNAASEPSSSSTVPRVPHGHGPLAAVNRRRRGP
jgi:hypothetical protein